MSCKVFEILQERGILFFATMATWNFVPLAAIRSKGKLGSRDILHLKKKFMGR